MSLYTLLYNGGFKGGGGGEKGKRPPPQTRKRDFDKTSQKYVIKLTVKLVFINNNVCEQMNSIKTIIIQK